jgi:hypothetical protein
LIVVSMFSIAWLYALQTLGSFSFSFIYFMLV